MNYFKKSKLKSGGARCSSGGLYSLESVQVQSAGCTIPCALCGSKNIDVLSLKDRKGDFLRTVICKECGLVWTDPRPDDANIKRYYEKDYRLHYKKTYEPKLKHVSRACDVALDRYDKIKDILRPKDAVLDVGSGGGEFVYILTKIGFLAEGIEPSQGYANYSVNEYGIRVHVGFIQNINLPEKAFDVITIFHVLEHTEDPSGVISKIKKSLKPGGYLVVEVPNVEAVCQAPSHRFHFAHLYNFNSKTLEMLGRSAGFTVHESRLSEDGGNLFIIFKSFSDGSVLNRTIKGNYEHIVKVIKEHTAISHYLSAYPYSRLASKIVRFLNEKKTTSKFTRGRDIIDAHFNKSYAESKQQ